jgi:hypothetical protein
MKMNRCRRMNAMARMGGGRVQISTGAITPSQLVALTYFAGAIAPVVIKRSQTSYHDCFYVVIKRHFVLPGLFPLVIKQPLPYFPAYYHMVTKRMLPFYLGFFSSQINAFFLNLVVCILLRVLDQVQGFRSNATLFQ